MPDTHYGFYWLASYLKSGNTWCRVFLLNYIHDEKVGINELSEIPLISTKYLSDSILGINSSELTPSEIFDFRTEGLHVLQSRLTHDMILKVHDIRATDTSRNLFAKDITKGVIYIVRNPLDIAFSLANHLLVSVDKAVSFMDDENSAINKRDDKYELSFKQELGTWSSHVESWTKDCKDRFLLLRYEDLLQDPMTHFRRLVRFIGLPEDTDRLKKAVERSSFDSLKNQEQTQGFREKPTEMTSFFREGVAGSWLHHLNKRQIESIVKNHHQQMTRMGYLNERGEPCNQGVVTI